MQRLEASCALRGIYIYIYIYIYMSLSSKELSNCLITTDNLKDDITKLQTLIYRWN